MKHLLVPYPALLLDKKGTFDKTLFLDDPRFFACNLFPKTGDSAVRLIDDPSLPDQKYILEISSDGVSIRAASETALQYGLVTLKQLVNQYKEHLPCLTIEDQPLNRHRAVQICTGQLNVDYRKDWFFTFVQDIAMLKATHLYLYFEMDYPFSCLPHYRRKGQITTEDLRELIRFAQIYKITVVPCINVLGHCGDFLSYQIHNDLKEYDADSQNPLYSFSSSLCIHSQKVRSLVENMINEICDLFPSDIIHVGGDEVDMIGKCPQCKTEFEKLGKNGIYLQYFLFINSILKSRGRKMGLWSDEVLIMEPDSSFWCYRKEQCDPSKRSQDFAFLDQMRDNVIFYDWFYNGESKISQKFFADNNLPFIACASTLSCYVSSCIPAQGFTQHALYSNAEKKGTIGMLTTDWINQTCSHAELHTFSLAAGLALNWCGCGDSFCKNSTLQEFLKAFSFQKFRISDDSLSEYLFYAGDFRSELLSLFPPELRGVTLRKCVFATANPLNFSMLYSHCLSGENIKKYRDCVQHLQKLFSEIDLKNQNKFFFIYKLPLIVHRVLCLRYEKFDRAFQKYDLAAKIQFSDPKQFQKLLSDAADLIRSHKEDNLEALQFAQDCSEIFGLENSPVLRMRETISNIDRLADFILSLRDGHRLLPAIHRIARFLFSRPQTYYWECGSYDWMKENQDFVSFDEDNDPAVAVLQTFASKLDDTSDQN